MKRLFLIFTVLGLFLVSACVGIKTQDSKDNESVGKTGSDFSILLNTDTEAIDFVDYYVPTGGDFDSAATPSVTVIRSKAELDAYCTANRERLGLDAFGGDSVHDTELSFMEASVVYTEAFFRNQGNGDGRDLGAKLFGLASCQLGRRFGKQGAEYQY